MPKCSVRVRALVVAGASALLFAACGSDDDPTVSFTEPTDGASVAGGAAVAMTAEGITIEEAGEVQDGAGHFHVIADAGCVETGTAVPRDADHVHLGGGQSEGTIYLDPGTHELCLQVGDGAHVALGATDTATVEVGITDPDQWCAVVGEVNDLFQVNDDDAIDYPDRQVGYENILRLLAQLTAALDQVDAEVRDDVAAAMDFGRVFATAYVESEDYESAAAALEDVYGEEGVQSDGPGSTWILENCDVDIDG